MNSLLSRLENKIGKYAIDNLPLVMVILFAVGYLMSLVNPAILYYISLDPYAILKHGQIWRLVTWVLIPPSSRNLFYVIIALYFYYSIGTVLNKTWGKFYFNVYIFGGCLFVILGAFLAYFFYAIVQPEFFGSVTFAAFTNIMFTFTFSTYYVCMSIFLAFAATYPDAHVFLFFILPIKVNVLGIIYVIYMFYEALSTANQLGMDFALFQVYAIVVSLLNFGIFFLSTRKIFKSGRRMGMGYAKNSANASAKAPKKPAPKMRPNTIAKHKCAICGQNSEDNPDLEFRFCSKCEGNYEYCQNHLFTHTHKKRDM